MTKWPYIRQNKNNSHCCLSSHQLAKFLTFSSLASSIIHCQYCLGLLCFFFFLYLLIVTQLSESEATTKVVLFSQTVIILLSSERIVPNLHQRERMRKKKKKKKLKKKQAWLTAVKIIKHLGLTSNKITEAQSHVTETSETCHWLHWRLFADVPPDTYLMQLFAKQKHHLFLI